MRFANLRWLTTNLDYLRIPLNGTERDQRKGDVPYWGANKIVDYVDTALLDEKVILIGEDGAPFFDRDRDVAFLSEGPIWPNNHVHILRCDEGFVQPQYLVYALNQVEYVNYINGATRDKLTQEQLGSIKIPMPPKQIQTAIAAYLDRETGRIDGLIGEKGRFVALLREKRVAAISHAVTKGFDRAAPLKPSGQDWLGDVPAHWEIVSAKRLFRQMARPVHEDDGIITAFRDGQVCLRTKRRTDGFMLADKEVGYQRIHQGDLVIHSMDAFAGAVGVSEDSGKATGEYVVCTPRRKDVRSRYYALVLRTMATREYIIILCPSVRERAPRFRYVRFAPVPLPVPPLPEQDAILETIDRETARIDALITETERSIALLREKRAALITAAVTGQIEIGDAA